MSNMGTIESITKICNDFKQRRFGIEEFQSRLQTLVIQKTIKPDLEKVLYHIDNRLEEIRFCSLQSNYYLYGIEVADSLLEYVKDLK